MGSMAERAQIEVRGVVQGVGFRPYIYSLASSLGLKGFVTNTADGVLIDVEGTATQEFLQRLRIEAPPLSRITETSIHALPLFGYPDFSIRQSTGSTNSFTLISPDAATCGDCLHEMSDPHDRRYCYPFINCINCGPRYSITRQVPYDRANTTMSSFIMCPACEKEYRDPGNRRFHAQPNACPVCGPRVTLKIQNDAFSSYADQGPIAATINILKNGGIVAIKGLGGFHIACDAANDVAVKLLRQRKRKSNKPFALMAATVDHIRAFCAVSPIEQDLLGSRRRPIVLLRKQRKKSDLSNAVAPSNNYTGFMLPYTPLHHLLFTSNASEGNAHFSALVMTSGNLSEEPIVHRNDDAYKKLSGLVDAYLVHDRDIFMRVDDSVVRTVSFSRQSAIHTPQSEIEMLRRSRGYAPDPIQLKDEGPEVLGVGGDLKNTFTLTKGSVAVPSQHIGDMENYETLLFFEETLDNLKQVYRVDPVAIAHDLHPGYCSTRWAMDRVRIADFGFRSDITRIGIQHHYAHIGSVMAEHGLRGPVIGVAFDGTGYGMDGNLWGGEFLIAGIDSFTRAGQFKYLPLPGGEAAVREPWRTAVSYVMDAYGELAADMLDRIGFFRRHDKHTVEQIMKIRDLHDVSPLSSGAGRLFDAISSILGLCDQNTYEGEAAVALESLVVEAVAEEYPVVFKKENEYTVLDFGPVVKGIIEDLLLGTETNVLAARFHNTISSVIGAVVRDLHEKTGIRDIVLSGGTFQNIVLLKRSIALLRADTMNVFVNEQMPPNDACISLGQAYLVRERLKKGASA